MPLPASWCAERAPEPARATRHCGDAFDTHPQCQLHSRTCFRLTTWRPIAWQVAVATPTTLIVTRIAPLAKPRPCCSWSCFLAAVRQSVHLEAYPPVRLGKPHVPNALSALPCTVAGSTALLGSKESRQPRVETRAFRLFAAQIAPHAHAIVHAAVCTQPVIMRKSAWILLPPSPLPKNR